MELGAGFWVIAGVLVLTVAAAIRIFRVLSAALSVGAEDH